MFIVPCRGPRILPGKKRTVKVALPPAKMLIGNGATSTLKPGEGVIFEMDSVAFPVLWIVKSFWLEEPRITEPKLYGFGVMLIAGTPAQLPAVMVSVTPLLCFPVTISRA